MESPFVVGQFGPILLIDPHLLLRLDVVFPFMELMPCWSLFKGKMFSSNNFIIPINVCHNKLYWLYCDNNNAFFHDESWSLNGLLVCDHHQINMKWVTNYNSDSIFRLTFVLEGENNWAIGCHMLRNWHNDPNDTSYFCPFILACKSRM